MTARGSQREIIHLQEVLPLSRTCILHGGFHPLVCYHTADRWVRVCPRSHSRCNVLRLRISGPDPRCWPLPPKESTIPQHRCGRRAALPAGMPSSRYLLSCSQNSHFFADRSSSSGHAGPRALAGPSLLSGEMGNPTGAGGSRRGQKRCHGPTSACAGEGRCLRPGFSSCPGRG